MLENAPCDIQAIGSRKSTKGQYNIIEEEVNADRSTIT